MKEKSKIGKFFLCWSWSWNARKIWYTPTPKDNRLGVLNGVWVLSICWVMLGHSFTMLIEVPVPNILDLQSEVALSWFFPFITGGFFSVDTFFFLSAFLGSMLMLEKFYSKKRINFFLVYLHWVMRLLPAIVLVAFAIITFWDIIGTGPYYE